MVAGALQVLALTPARGGSKGVPRKNIRRFGGHPLLAWSIAAGHHARLVDRVIVSTDDEEIAGVAISYGAEVPFLRPAKLAGDATPDFPVFQHALDWLEVNEGYRPDIVVHLRPTSPVRPVGLVDEAVEALLSGGNADSVRSVTRPAQNPYKMWTVSRGDLKPLIASNLHEPYNAPRQSLPETYWQTGHVDVFWRSVVRRKHSLTGDRIRPVMVASRYAFDLDDLVQWRVAEASLSEFGLDIVRPTGGCGPAREACTSAAANRRQMENQ